ncbi:polyhomeotic-like protein 1 [Chiloscyllium punctatum]|uniref:polyhomeotic-like protein 1 n=1 Tax=Chiloscyllium punctatum TaxID=137246 RepID=UPI003B631A8B
MLTCEFCGRLEQADKFKRSKRFCSMACAKRYNVSCRKGVRRFTVDRQNPFQKDPDPRTGRRSTRKGSTEAARGSIKRLFKDDPAGRVSDSCCYDEGLSPLTQLRQSLCDRETPDLMGGPSGLHSASPGQWTVQQVHQFISSLPGCQDLAEDFQTQEIDGQALLLLKEEHLMTAMNIKLGPALKICAQINMLKEV